MNKRIRKNEIKQGFKEFWGNTFFSTKKGIGVFLGLSSLMFGILIIMFLFAAFIAWLINYIRVL